MSLLVVTNLEKSFGGDTILEDVSFRLEWRQKLGLVGRNGCGKTTLLRLLTGQQEPDSGTIQYASGISAGYLRQEDAVDPHRTVLQEAEAAFQHVLDMERRLREVEHEMADAGPEALDELMREYGILHDRFDAMGGYDNLRDVPGVLKRLGFGPRDLDKLCGRLSGGEKTRLAIARLLLSGPDILYLDEPTNHLDIEATEWLEGFLKDFGGALVLVSHDRYFLDRVVTTVASIESCRLNIFNGNYSAFTVQREAARARQADVYEREQREIARLTEFFEKWKNTPTKRSQAMERLRWAERIRKNAVEKPDAPGKKVKLAIKPTQLSGGEVVILDNVGMRYGDRVLFENVCLLIRRGDRVGLVGPNGAGKSTLVKLILERETPSSGMTRLGTGVTVGYFAQDTSDLDPDASVLENMLDVAELSPTEARTHLGRFLFTGDDVFRPVRLLSGGEKNKLVLAQLIYMRPNLLILDEPTNHLDIDSREALGKMLREYAGTLLLVSHDRYLLDQVTNRTVEVAGGALTVFDGPYGEFRAARAAGRIHAEAVARATNVQRNSPLATGGRQASLDSLLAQRPAAVIADPRAGMNAHQLSKERQRARARLDTTEKRIETLEQKLREIEHNLANPRAEMNLVALAQEHTGVESALVEAMEAWEQAAAYVESLQ